MIDNTGPAVGPIVAIGASAGGLEAVSRLFELLPHDSGMAFLVVQHLEPTHKSLMVDLLATHTVMPVAEAVEGAQLHADHVYVIPPGRYLSVRAGLLHVSTPDAPRGARLPFDHLLASLAQSCGPRTVAVILSGTGGDGSAGLQALHQAGGGAIAQCPVEAEYAGMPQSAIATGLVDRIVPLAQMPAAIAAVAGHMPSLHDSVASADGQAAAFAEILNVVKASTAHDFHAYKPGTIGRRIERRMGLLGLPTDNLDEYLERLRHDPAECGLLAQDLLINVTSFFRDPAVFDALETTVLPDLLDRLGPDQPLRVWVAGCSTGEEVYSLAMVCCDAMLAGKHDVRLQIFASDLDAAAVAIAREGLYGPDIAEVVPHDRLARYFAPDPKGFRVNANLRGHVVFVVQDVLSDPPFSRMDLVSCRNLLIYLNIKAQAKAIGLFHFALKDGGVLLLGAAETVGQSEGRFEPLPRAECCFRHLGTSHRTVPAELFTLPAIVPVPWTEAAPAPLPRQGSLADICSKAVLAYHAPAALLINRRHECLYSMGPTERYLRMAPGYASLDVLAMAPPDLRTRLRLAIARAGSAEPRVDGGRASLVRGDATIWFRIDVQWLGDSTDDLLLISFIEQATPDQPAGEMPAQAARIAELERELAAAHAEMEAAIETRRNLEQEQKTINEEARSVNEEFQSTNEELLTSKEELQSLNEELTALNSQLQQTLERERLASDDLHNVLYSTNVGTMFLDSALKIRFFTPAISPLFSVIPGDIGRPIDHLRPIADDPHLVSDVRRVLDEGSSIDRDVRTPDGNWYLRRIFPYRAQNTRVDGVVITFADVTEVRRTTAALEATKREAERANIAKSRFLAAASHDLRQPLQSLTLLTGLLEHAVENIRATDLLHRFSTTLRTMSDMLDGLLNINQIEAGVIKPNLSAFALGTVFDRLRSEFAMLTEPLDLSLRIMPGTMQVVSDPRLLEQMLRNLLGNAIKYTPQGRVLVGARRHGEDVRIEVWDTGIGIRADQLQVIFEEFHQVDMASYESSGGLGLGLSIVRRLGLLLGYRVDVRSQPGHGSIFAITVPGAASAMLPAPAVVPEPRDRPQPGQGALLVVDDDPEVLDLLKLVLRPAGYLVTGAPDAAAALRLVTEGAIRPDVVLTDYNLPNGINGLDLLARLRAHLGDAVPAIVLSGDISTLAITRISAANCVRLAKPVDPDRLIDTIRQICPVAPAPPPLPDAHAATADPVVRDPQALPLIHVVDDDMAIRETMREVLETHGLRVADHAGAEAFLAAYRPGGESALLLDAHMPGMSGLDLLHALRARGDHMPVILITGSGDIALAVAAMRAGASNFLEKPVGRADILACVDQALGQSRDTHQTDSLRAEAAARMASLTPRQREVLRRVLAGEPSKNIAADLDISQRTVENHRAEIMHKMKVRSIPELVKLAIGSEVQ